MKWTKWQTKMSKSNLPLRRRRLWRRRQQRKIPMREKKYERKTKYNQKKKHFHSNCSSCSISSLYSSDRCCIPFFFILKVCFHFHTFFIRCLFSYFSHTKSIRMETISFHLSLWQSSHESSHWKAIWNCISSSSKSSTTINSIKSTFGKRYCGFSVYFFSFSIWFL